MTAHGDTDYQFRYKLKSLSDQLTSSDLENLKSLCSEHVNVENITSGITLWRSLQDSGKLSINNLDYLKLLLTSIEKPHLYENVFNPTSNGVASQSNTVIPHQQSSNGDIDIQEGNYDTGEILGLQHNVSCNVREEN